MSNAQCRKFNLAAATVLLLAATCRTLPADQTNAPDTNAVVTEASTISFESLRTFLQLQEQLHATQQAIEQSRGEIEKGAARNAEAVDARLQLIEQSLASQRARELDTMQSANRLVLIVAGTFAGVGFLAMLLTALLQWRGMNRLAEISAVPRTALSFGAGHALAPLGPGEPPPNAGAAEQSNARLLDAIERLERRILELELTARVPLSEGTPVSGEAVSATASAEVKARTPGHAAARSVNADRVTLLLAKGQSLLNLDDPEQAVACFDEVLELDRNHPEALVKKGAALERMRQVDEAIKCYDRAIAVDDSMTIAYLYKGGLFNRLERYSEALDCYERALRTHEKRHR